MIILHHLNFSRSSRIIWLMEELGLPYELVRYERNERFRAPPSLQRSIRSARAPIIEDGGLVLAESAVILGYINDRHGEDASLRRAAAQLMCCTRNGSNMSRARLLRRSSCSSSAA